MRCKPGDLAMTVAPFNVGGIGQFVTVVRLAKSEEMIDGIAFYARVPSWVVDGTFRTDGNVFRGGVIADICLRPIRDPGDDAVDEMLQRLGGPNKVLDHVG